MRAARAWVCVAAAVAIAAGCGGGSSGSSGSTSGGHAAGSGPTTGGGFVGGAAGATGFVGGAGGAPAATGGAAGATSGFVGGAAGTSPTTGGNGGAMASGGMSNATGGSATGTGGGNAGTSSGTGGMACGVGNYPCQATAECCAGLTCGASPNGSMCCTPLGQKAVDDACCYNGADIIVSSQDGTCCGDRYAACTQDSSCCNGFACDTMTHECCTPLKGDATKSSDCCTGTVFRPTMQTSSGDIVGSCVKATCDAPGTVPCSSDIDCCVDQVCAGTAADPTPMCRRPALSQDPPCTSDAECADGICQQMTTGARCCVSNGFTVSADGSSPPFECCSEWANGSGAGTATCDGNCGPPGVVCLDAKICCSGSCSAGLCN